MVICGNCAGKSFARCTLATVTQVNSDDMRAHVGMHVLIHIMPTSKRTCAANCFHMLSTLSAKDLVKFMDSKWTLPTLYVHVVNQKLAVHLLLWCICHLHRLIRAFHQCWYVYAASHNINFSVFLGIVNVGHGYINRYITFATSNTRESSFNQLHHHFKLPQQGIFISAA